MELIDDMDGYTDEYILETVKLSLNIDEICYADTKSLKNYINDYLNQHGYDYFINNGLTPLLKALIVIIGSKTYTIKNKNRIWACYKEYSLTDYEVSRAIFNTIKNTCSRYLKNNLISFRNPKDDIDTCMNTITEITSYQIIKPRWKFLLACAMYAESGDYSLKGILEKTYITYVDSYDFNRDGTMWATADYDEVSQELIDKLYKESIANESW